ncbi:MAG: hypothetical protein WCK14_03695 [Actinomycetota bacterium]|jgi:hypothetical protein
MRLSRFFAVAVVAPLVFSGCITGKRPSFGSQSDPAIAAVLSKLDTSIGPFTASYSILTRLGNITTPVTVAIQNPTERSITFNDIRFLQSTAGYSTCTLSNGSCSLVVDEASISNLAVTHDFYGASAAARIRQDATTMVGPAITSSETYAGQNATCVQLSFTSGTKKYCVLDNGMLAYQDTPDLQITLTKLTDAVDTKLFETSVAGL